MPLNLTHKLNVFNLISLTVLFVGKEKDEEEKNIVIKKMRIN
jgi:hypothetical protein